MPSLKKHKRATKRPERSSPALPIDTSRTPSTAVKRRRQPPPSHISKDPADGDDDNEFDPVDGDAKKLGKREDNDDDDEDDDGGAGDGSWSAGTTSATSLPTTVNSKVKLHPAPTTRTRKRQRAPDQQPQEPVLDLFSKKEVKDDFDDELKIEEEKEEGHESKFNILKDRICAMSVAKGDWKLACSEWDLENVYEQDNGECLCTHRPIRDHCVIRNRKNGEVTTIATLRKICAF